MSLKIRLARMGIRHDPHYKINVANSWCKRDGKHIESLGTYHPKPDPSGIKRVYLNMERTKYWLGVGARPTDTVAILLGKAGILPSLPRGKPLVALDGDANCSQTTASDPKTD